MKSSAKVTGISRKELANGRMIEAKIERKIEAKELKATAKAARKAKPAAQPTKPVKGATKPAKVAVKPAITGGLEVIEYSDKAIAVFGNTKAYKDQLYALKGRFNKFLRRDGEITPGWIFSLRHEAEVVAFVESVN